jgi:hypothetical protein
MSAARLSADYEFLHYFRHENGNLKKNTFCKIESSCHSDSKHIFGSKIVHVLYEKIAFEVDNFKTHFKMMNFEFASVWSPLPQPLPPLGLRSTL